jgi:hypothetical protein
MTADEKALQYIDSIPADRTGKVFAILGKNMRMCLVCEVVFMRLAAREHAKVTCRPPVAQKNDYVPPYSICVSFAPPI